MNLSGSQIAGRYEIRELVSEGKTSYVYRAIDINSSEPVAAKLLKPEFVSGRLEDIIRFQKVIDTLSKINHPNLTRIFGYYSPSESMTLPMYCIIMELFPGIRLTEAAKQKFSPEEACEVVCQICRALVSVHSIGIIHGDIKPENILLAESKERRGEVQIKLVDFGLSRIKKIEEDKQDYGISGTYFYMPPEQAGIIRKNIDERSDLYSLGVVFYELLTGRLPFMAESLVKLLHEQAAKIPYPPSGGKAATLDAIVLKLLEKEPDRRYQTAAGLLHDLELFLSGKRDFAIGQADSKSRIDFTGKFAGRETELARLIELYKDAGSGNGRLCIITGEAGIGKSRLMEELKNHIIAHGDICIEGRAFKAGKTPHSPFHEAVSDYMRQFQRYSKEQQEKIAEAVKYDCRNLGRIITDFNPRALAILGECPEIIKLEQEREAQRFYITLAKFFFSLAEAENGLVLLLDDLHWSDVGTIRLLEEILRDLKNKSILIIGSFRESDLPADHPLRKMISENKERYIEKIILTNLNKDAVHAFLKGIIEMNEEDSVSVSDFILKNAGGNPLFSLEILKELIASGVVVYKRNSWVVDKLRLSAIKIPKTILDILYIRLQKLSPEEINLLTRASVIGKAFNIDLLMQMEAKDKKEKQMHHASIKKIVDIIDRGVGKQILTMEDQGRYLFSHDSVHNAFIERIASNEKKKLHGRIGRILENIGRENLDSIIFDLTYHFIEANDEEKILEYVYAAALKARERYSYGDAVNYLIILRNIQSVKKNKFPDSNNQSSWISFSMLLSETYLDTGSSREALEILKELLPIVSTEQQKIQIYLLITRACYKNGDFTGAEENAKKGLSLLGERLLISKSGIAFSIIREIINRVLISKFPKLFISQKQADIERYRAITWFYNWLYWSYFFSDYMKLAWCILRMLNIAEKRIGKSRELIASMLNYAVMRTSLSSDSGVIADKILSKANSITEIINDKWASAECQWAYAYHYFLHCEFSKALEHAEQCVNLYNKIGDAQGLRRGMFLLFYSSYINSNYNYAYNIYSECTKYFKTVFDEISVLSWGFPAEYYIETADYSRAEEILMKHIAFQREKKIWYLYTMSCMFLGHLCLEKDETDKAYKWLDEAQSLINSNNFPKYFLTNYYILYAQLLIKDYLKQDKQLSHKDKADFKEKIKKSVQTALNKTKKMQINVGITYRVAASYYVLMQNADKASQFFELSISANQKIGRRYELARSLFEYGVFLRHTGNKQGAWEKLTGAYLLFEEIGINQYREKIAPLLGLSVEIGKAVENTIFRERMQYMVDKSREFAYIFNLSELLNAVLLLAMELSGARNGYLFIAEDEEEILKCVCEKHVDPVSISEFSWNIVNNVYNTGKSIVAVDAEADETLSLYHSVTGQKLKSVLCLPVLHNEILSGVCYLDNPLSGGIFMHEEEQLLSIMLTFAAITMENLILHDRLKAVKSFKRNERPPDLDRKYLEAAFEYIDSHFEDTMQREQIAGNLGITPDYLGRLFKSCTSKTIQEYVNEVRIKDASERLLNSDTKIIDIAMDVGFDSARTFNRVFYRIMGITPSEYREKIAGR